MIRPLVIALVGALGGAGLAFGFQTLRPPAAETEGPAGADEGSLAGMTACEQVEVLRTELGELQVAITENQAALSELETYAAGVLGSPAPWSGEAPDPTASLTDAVGKHGGQVLVLDCSENPCIHASLFQGPDADGDGFVAGAAAQGHQRVAVLAGNNAENVPHQIVIRTVDGPEAADSPAAKRIEYRMQNAYNGAIARITFEPLDPAKPQMGWTIAPDPAETNEGDAPQDGGGE
ncbi:MAG: hypothetical protein AAF602_19605 [Myxococcota bacterium]